MIQRRIKEPAVKEVTLSFTIEVTGIGPIVSLGLTNGVLNDQKPFPAGKRKHRRYSERIEEVPRRFTYNRRTSSASVSLFDLQKSVMASKRYLAPMHFSSAENVQTAVRKIREKESKALDESKNDVYSKNFVPKKYSKYSNEYGSPPPGSLTEMRAKKAAKHIAREILQLCQVIEEHGHQSRRTNQVIISFGELFHIYTFISDKVVGLLLRARKHGMVTFEGEMLYQRRDEEKIITLLISHEQIQQSLTDI